MGSMSFIDTSSHISTYHHVVTCDISCCYDMLPQVFSTPSTTIHIPHIIHQIWLGGELPITYHAYVATWKSPSSTWSYRLWNDTDTTPIVSSRDDVELYDHVVKLYACAQTPVEKSDIMRLEILYQHGVTCVVHSVHQFFCHATI